METHTTIQSMFDAAGWLMKRYPDLIYPAALELIYLYLDGPYRWKTEVLGLNEAGFSMFMSQNSLQDYLPA